MRWLEFLFRASPVRPWSVAEVPRLDLREESVLVEIGSLGGEEHRRAFAAVFAKLLSDNAKLLEDMELCSIDAKRPIQPTELGAVELPIDLRDLKDRPAFALGLYDSRNEEVRLRLHAGPDRWTLGVRFDNPRFWLQGGGEKQDQLPASERRRIAAFTRQLHRGELSYPQFLEVVPQECVDEDVAELVDLIEHEPKRGGFLGASESAHEANLARIQALIRLLETSE